MRWLKFCEETIINSTESPIRQLINLNCLLRDLTRAGQFSDSLNLFQQIHSSHNLKPDQFSVSTTLTVCANIHDVLVGSQLHAYSIQSALNLFPHVSNSLLSFYTKSQDLFSVKKVFDEIKKPDIYSYTTLISACANLGEFDYALSLFYQMPLENVPVWNAIISGCLENWHDEIAFDVFHKMHSLGIKADNYTYASVLSLCSLKDFGFGRQVHSAVVKTGYFARTSVINSLLTMYFNCKCAACAFAVFEELDHVVRDEITYNAVIAGLGSVEREDEALLMFKDMQNVGLKPTDLTFLSVMGACMFCRMAVQIHCQAIKMGFEYFTSVSNATISMYSRCEELNAACLVFERLEAKDVVSWNAVIASYSQENLGTDAIFAYMQMQKNGIEPDEFTIGGLLASLEWGVLVEMIHAVVIKNALILKHEVSNALVSAFSSCNEISQANKLFCDMYSRNLISWNAMISGYRLNGLPEQGLQQFFELLQSGMRPNHYTLSIVLNIYASKSDLRHGKQMHAYILRFMHFSHVLIGNSLIAFYAHVGALHLSLRVFQTMVHKDVVSWNSVISAYAQNGEGNKAMNCFQDMQFCGKIRPDKATFTAVLTACSRSGLVAEGIQIFSVMVKDYDMEPDTSHFSIIVDLLGRAGYLDIAERLINSKDINVDSSVWWTLFSLCTTHGNFQLGSIIAGYLLELGNEDPAVYVLLSNIYANAGKWEESADVRELMKKYGVTKQPGSSWIGA
ncbi:pentatricopeptide repeat-containing protein At3g49740 [Primulina huaijiensis]|uniref:pentatricopeptide repeat-containing protein At3g49740 n=1 Tax=Primulina huaijiensis TaxID=1492673 RepID=UPI003CC77BAE